MLSERREKYPPRSQTPRMEIFLTFADFTSPPESHSSRLDTHGYFSPTLQEQVYAFSDFQL